MQSLVFPKTFLSFFFFFKHRKNVERSGKQPAVGQGDLLRAKRCFMFSGESSFFLCLVSEEVIVCDASLAVDESLARIMVVLLLVVFAGCSLHGC